MEKYMTIQEFADKMEVHRNTVANWMKEGLLKFTFSIKRKTPKGTPKRMIPRTELTRLNRIAL